MKDIEVNGAHITDESAEILKQWQVKTEPVSACYIRVIEETIDDLTDEGGEPLSAEKNSRKNQNFTHDEKRHRKVV